jgi:DNA anti-recombination protein RmuC
MKKILPLLLLMFVFAPQAFTHAQDDSDTSSGSEETNTTTETYLNTDRAERIRDTIRTFAAPNERINKDAEIEARMRANIELKNEYNDSEKREGVQIKLRAENASSTEMRKEEAEKRQEEMKQKQEERQTNLKGEMKDRLGEFLKRTVARFEAAIERLNDMANRIDSRIQKLADRDVDVATAQSLLADARISIGEASDAVLSVEVEIATALESESPREALGGVRELLVVARDAIKDAHRALVAVIVELKQGLLQLEADASVDSEATTDSDTTEDES